jgi:hypothetical protein
MDWDTTFARILLAGRWEGGTSSRSRVVIQALERTEREFSKLDRLVAMSGDREALLGNGVWYESYGVLTSSNKYEVLRRAKSKSKIPVENPTKSNRLALNISRHRANPSSAPGFRCSGHTELGRVEMSDARCACKSQGGYPRTATGQ